jgi:hypothetical protein
MSFENAWSMKLVVHASPGFKRRPQISKEAFNSVGVIVDGNSDVNVDAGGT